MQDDAFFESILLQPNKKHLVRSCQPADDALHGTESRILDRKRADGADRETGFHKIRPNRPGAEKRQMVRRVQREPVFFRDTPGPGIKVRDFKEKNAARPYELMDFLNI